MFTVDINGVKHDAKVTFYTAQLYELEFRADLIQDLFGIQTAEQSIEFEAEGEGEERTVRVARIDFTKVSWAAVMKVLWAAIKTAEPSTPSYAQWTKGASGVNLWLVQEQVGEEVSDCFFRSGAAEEDSEEEEQ